MLIVIVVLFNEMMTWLIRRSFRASLSGTKVAMVRRYWAGVHLERKGGKIVWYECVTICCRLFNTRRTIIVSRKVHGDTRGGEMELK